MGLQIFQRINIAECGFHVAKIDGMPANLAHKHHYATFSAGKIILNQRGQAAMSQRRPLILDEAGQAAWLNPETPLAELHSLLASPAAALRERVLANLVNDPKLNAPECLTPA